MWVINKIKNHRIFIRTTFNYISSITNLLSQSLFWRVCSLKPEYSFSFWSICVVGDFWVQGTYYAIFIILLAYLLSFWQLADTFFTLWIRHFLGRSSVNIGLEFVLSLISNNVKILWNFGFSVVRYVHSRTDQFILLEALNSFRNQHVFDSLIGSLRLFRHLICIVMLVRVAFCTLFNRQVFRLGLWVDRMFVLGLNVDSLMFFPEYSWHVFNFFLLFGNTSDIIGCLGAASVVDYRAESFLEDLI